MRRVAEEADLQAGYVSFQNKQISQITEALRQGDTWTKIRAAANLKAQQEQMQQYRSMISSEKANSDLQSALFLNESLDQQVNRELESQQRTPDATQAQDNRKRLNQIFKSQTMSRARNVVNSVGANWGDAMEQTSSGNSTRAFNSQWMAQNKLADGESQSDNKGGGRPQGDKFGKWAAGGTDFGGVAGRAPARQLVPAADMNSDYAARQQPSAAQVLVAPQGQQLGVAQLAVPTVRSNQTAGFGYNVQAGESQNAAGMGGQAGGEDNAKINAQTYERYKARVDQQVVEQQAQVSTSTFDMPRTLGTLALPKLALPRQAFVSDASLAGKQGGPRSSVDQAEEPPSGLPPVPAPAAAAPCLPTEAAVTAPAKPADGLAATAPPEGKPQAVQHAIAGMASLDFELPSADESRWTLYRFTTPRGDEEITARNISSDLVRRLVEIVAVAVALLLMWLVWAAVGMVRRSFR